MEDYTIEQIRQLLRYNVVEVVFTKADGSERIMLASTNSMYIPKTDSKAKESLAKDWSKEEISPNVTVRDIEIGAWRSFKFENLIKFTVLDLPVLEVEVVAA